MQHLEVSCAVRPIEWPLGVKWLRHLRGYCKLKEAALDGAVWGTGFGRVCGPFVEQTADWKNKQCFNKQKS